MEPLPPVAVEPSMVVGGMALQVLCDPLMMLLFATGPCTLTVTVICVDVLPSDTSIVNVSSGPVKLLAGV